MYIYIYTYVYIYKSKHILNIYEYVCCMIIYVFPHVWIRMSNIHTRNKDIYFTYNTYQNTFCTRTRICVTYFIYEHITYVCVSSHVSICISHIHTRDRDICHTYIHRISRVWHVLSHMYSYIIYVTYIFIHVLVAWMYHTYIQVTWDVCVT